MKKLQMGMVFWLLVATYVATESHRLGLGTWRMPGPGTFPFITAMLLGSVSLFTTVKTLRKTPPQNLKGRSRGEANWQNVPLVLVAMIAYVFLLSRAGFLLSTFALILFFLRVIASQRCFSAILIAVAIALGSHIVFNILLDAQFPKGILGF